MKAIIFDTFGPASVLKEAQVSSPTPKKGEVLIRISHTSVNPVDWKIREGYLKDMLPHVFPVIPGWDAAGEVVALGEAVTNFKVGDAVYAYARLPEVHSGTYAELIALPESFVAHKPKGLTFAEAAATPLVALTAYQALHEVAKIKKGDRVLITGAAGGVGSFALQFAKIVGSEITATAGSSNQEYLKELGAHYTINYQNADAWQKISASAPEGFDVILDTVGGETLAKAISLTKGGSRTVSIVERPPIGAGEFHFVYPSGSQLEEIGKLFDSGLLQSPALSIRSIREAALAQTENAERHTRGKIVLAIDF